ncbi:ly-6/neurotoxin-like protein 1 isoform X2 [Vicugna pacos]|uniref:Ly-6/neurotoxin-like protein 1 n=1 Tax=Vicugna pacos TaxID=30538 RepID=A0ABM5CBC0_VICPA
MVHLLLRAAVPPVDQELPEGRGWPCPLCALPQPRPELNQGPAAVHLPTLPSRLQPWHPCSPCSWWPWLACLWALDCHVCAYNGENCFNPTRCPAMVTYCMTTRTYYTPTRMKVSKSCVTSCFETVYDGYSKHASTTACCQYDLCNGASLAAPATLALALTLLASFWGLL